MTALRDDLSSRPEERSFGSGWISGVLALILSALGLGTVLCLMFPDVLTVADARKLYDVVIVRLALHFVLVAGFALAVLNLALRKQKVLGMTAIALTLVATALGGSHAVKQIELGGDYYLGLDWFMINLLFTGIVFIPIERFFGRTEQPIFRHEFREDLLYLLISSLFVQGLAFLSLTPAMAALHHSGWAADFRAAVASQPVVLQFFEIMFLTDLVQYWLHRIFHRVPFLWRFHAVHHSAQELDWLAGARMHLFEIVILRGVTVFPMYVFGFSESALYAYLFFVYLFSTLVHANLRLDFGKFEYLFVTPRFHHWHHGIEKEAIDVNFAVHFPLLDRLFGTYYLPDRQWPSGYGIKQEMPKGFVGQFLFPLKPEKY